MKASAPCVLLAFLLAACIHSTNPDPRALMDDLAPTVNDEGGEEELRSHPHGSLMRAQSRVNQGESLPPRAFSIALDQRRKTLEASPEVPSTMPEDWEWLGPGNIGGRIRAIVIHPSSTNTMWAGAASGGVWKTVNGGQSWAPLDDYPASLAIGCMVMEPGNPDHLYVGTGEGGYFDTIEGTSNTAAILGAGIFESTDGGDTWNQMPSTDNANFQAVSRMVIDPRNTAIIFAATREGIFHSQDTGATWTQRSFEPALDIDIHPTDSSKMLAGQGHDTCLYSTDAGLSWQEASGFSGDVHRTEVAYAVSNPDVVYAAMSIPQNSIISSLSIWRSDDGGQTFVRKTVVGDEINSLANYTTALFVDPTNADRILFGGQTIRRSADQGVTHFSISGGTHSDHHVIIPHPAFNGISFNRVIGGNDGGVFFRDEPFISSSWTELNNNLGVTQFYGAAVNPTTGVVTGGTQDNGSMRFDGDPEAWVKVLGGDGGFCAVDPTEADLFYVETQNLGIRRVRNVTEVTAIAGGISDTENFIPYFMVDPNLPGRMLAAGRSLWRSEDVRLGNPPTWSIIKPSFCPENHFVGNNPCNISTIAVAEGDSDIIWVGHNDGSLFRSPNGSSANPGWLRTDLGLPNRWVSRIAIDPRNHGRVYVSMMGYQSNNLWRTLDNGITWTQITGSGANSLPNSPITAIAVHPAVSGVLVAGTDFGIYRSLDDGNSWTTSSAGPGNAAIEELLWRNEDELYVVTHGRGIYKSKFSFDVAVSEHLGQGCGLTGTPALNSTAPEVGSILDFDLSGASPNSPAVLLLSSGPPSPLDLGLGCILQVSVGRSYVFRSGLTDALGNINFNASLVSAADLIGSEFTSQCAIQVNGGPVLGVAEMSNGLRLVVGL